MPLQAVELATASSSTVLLTWQGEPIRDLGVALKDEVKALGFDRAFVLGLSNDWGGYWLTPEEFDRGRYERTLMFYGRESWRTSMSTSWISPRPCGPARLDGR